MRPATDLLGLESTFNVRFGSLADMCCCVAGSEDEAGQGVHRSCRISAGVILATRPFNCRSGHLPISV
jgi:hypothetical protein